jgi:hypothetical protein
MNKKSNIMVRKMDPDLNSINNERPVYIVFHDKERLLDYRSAV